MNCPKCQLELPEEATWYKTKNNKNWIKMPDGKDHDCDRDKPFADPNNPTQRKYYCHECNSKCIECDEHDCLLCEYSTSYCPGCQTHVSVFDAK